MVAFKCDTNYNNLRQRLLGGKITSIWNDDTFFNGASSYPVLKFKE